MKKILDKVKGSKTLVLLSIVMITTNVVGMITGKNITGNLIGAIIWLIAFICCIKGW